jgi:hypothetical protein
LRRLKCVRAPLGLCVSSHLSSQHIQILCSSFARERGANCFICFAKNKVQQLAARERENVYKTVCSWCYFIDVRDATSVLYVKRDRAQDISGEQRGTRHVTSVTMETLLWRLQSRQCLNFLLLFSF